MSRPAQSGLLPRVAYAYIVVLAALMAVFWLCVGIDSYPFIVIESTLDADWVIQSRCATVAALLLCGCSLIVALSVRSCSSRGLTVVGIAFLLVNGALTYWLYPPENRRPLPSGRGVGQVADVLLGTLLLVVPFLSRKLNR